MSTTTQIFDDRSHNFTYTGSWDTDGNWSASNGQSGTLSSTNNETASVKFTFPVAATAFRYFGMKRSHGGQYGICVDCDLTNPSFVDIDAFDATDNGQNPPSLLFFRTFSAPSEHIIIIRNEPDPRGTPTGNSQLTLDRFELDVPVPPANTPASTVVQTSNTVTTVTQPPAQPSTGNGGGTNVNTSPSTRVATTVASTQAASSNASSLVFSSSSAVASQQSQSSTNSVNLPLSSTIAAGGVQTNGTTSPFTIIGASHMVPLGATIGGALGGLAAIAILIILIFWLRMRKQSTSLLTTARPLDALELSTATLDPTTTRTTVSTAPGRGWVTGYGVSAYEKGGRHYPQASFSSHPSDSAGSPNPSSSHSRLRSPTSPAPAPSTSSNTNTNTRSPRRELDAGPVPRHLIHDDNEDTETLPPDYGQLFNGHISERASQFLR